jgi:hypothetical protein
MIRILQNKDPYTIISPSILFDELEVKRQNLIKGNCRNIRRRR